MDLQQRIERLEAVKGIFGLTSDGLKAAVGYARKGFRVLCVDFRDFKVEMVNRGISFSNGISDMELFKFVKSGKIKATTDVSVIRKMDFLTIFLTHSSNKSENNTALISIFEVVSTNIKPGIIIGLDDENETLMMRDEVKRIMMEAGHTYGNDYLFGSLKLTQEG